MIKTFKNFQSSAVNSIEVVENIVKVVYNSNIDKEYTFTCENVDEFVENLSQELVGIELAEDKASVGGFLHRQVKSGVLIQTK